MTCTKTDPWDDVDSMLSDPPGEDDGMNTPLEEIRRSSPPQDFNAEGNANIAPVIPPTRKKRHGKGPDNEIDEDREVGNERTAKRRKATNAEPQAKTKPKPKPVFLYLILGQSLTLLAIASTIK